MSDVLVHLVFAKDTGIDHLTPVRAKKNHEGGVFHIPGNIGYNESAKLRDLIHQWEWQDYTKWIRP